MRVRDASVISSAAEFAGRFGFLSREIFFQHICDRSRANKYGYWNALVSGGVFYPSKGNRDVLHLTKSGFAIAGRRAIRWRPHIYIPHDTHVARLWFALDRTGLMNESWTEGQLKASPWDALRVLGSENIEKLPDLIVQLQSGERSVRLAIEVEATRKSKSKYDQIALSYVKAGKVDLILFVCEDAAVERSIQSAFDSDFFRNAQRQPVTGLLSDFRESGLQAPIRIASRELAFNRLLSKALRVDDVLEQSKRDHFETRVSKCGGDHGEAA